MNIQKKNQQGFTLIELMIVIAIIGILAAIALPAYQDYTVRAKMSEPIAQLAEAKTSFTEYYSSNNRRPGENGLAPANQQAGVLITRTSQFMDRINISDSEAIITARVLASAIPGATGPQTIELSGQTQPDGTINWVCKPGTTGNPVAAKFLPATCRG